MKKRNPYKTAQQEAMLQYFLEDKHNFFNCQRFAEQPAKIADRHRSDDGVPFSGAAGFGRICH